MTLSSPLLAAIPFQRPGWGLDALSASVAAQIVSAASDVALIIDRDGVVRDLSISSTDLAGKGLADWLDRPWSSAVTAESRHKVDEMLRDAQGVAPPRWRELNHPGANGEAFAIRYFAVSAGIEGRAIVIGRDLQASAALQQRLLLVQQSVERDYLRLRQAESRYRLLFHGGAEAVLILDAGTRRVREANPAAARMTGQPEGSLDGQTFAALLHADSVDMAHAALAGASGSTNSAPITVRLASGTVAVLTASLFRHDRSSCLLVRLTAEGASVDPTDSTAALIAVLDRIPDAFAVTGPDMRILAVNPAFLDLTNLNVREDAQDQPLERFLGRPQVDLKLLMSQLREHGSVRNFSTVLRGRFGEQEDVEVSAVSVPGDRLCYGFSIRSVARRLAASGMSVPPAPGIVHGPRSVEQLTQLIGRAPMKDIVRESTDLIERLCIEAALNLTSNNRAAAADMLGLSRQSLYSKLNRYGLSGGEAEED